MGGSGQQSGTRLNEYAYSANGPRYTVHEYAYRANGGRVQPLTREERRTMWHANPSSVEDIYDIFAGYVERRVPRLPWYAA